MDYRQISARVIIGSLAGLLFFSVDAVATLIRFLLHPAVAERAAAEAFFAMLLYLLLFVAAGALAGCMRAIRVRWLRFALIGAVAGAVVWRYLTATWALTARPASFVSPAWAYRAPCCSAPAQERSEGCFSCRLAGCAGWRTVAGDRRNACPLAGYATC